MSKTIHPPERLLRWAEAADEVFQHAAKAMLNRATVFGKLDDLPVPFEEWEMLRKPEHVSFYEHCPPVLIGIYIRGDAIEAWAIDLSGPLHKRPLGVDVTNIIREQIALTTHFTNEEA